MYAQQEVGVRIPRKAAKHEIDIIEKYKPAGKGFPMKNSAQNHHRRYMQQY